MVERLGLTDEKYRKFLTEAVKAAGQMMIDNAEDMADHIVLMTDFIITIKINLSQEDRDGKLIQNDSDMEEE